MKIIKRNKTIELKAGNTYTILSRKDIESLSPEEYKKLKNENPGFIDDMYRFCGFIVVAYNVSSDLCNVYDKISEKEITYTWHISYFKEFYQ